MTEPIRQFLSWFRAQFGEMLAEKSVLCFCVAAAVMCAAYRAWVFATVFAGGNFPLGFEPGLFSALALFKSLASDLLVGFVLGLVYLAGKKFAARFKFTRSRIFFGVELIVAVATLVVLSLLMLTHYHLVFEVEGGLNLMFLQLGSNQMALSDLPRLMTGWDKVFIALTLSAFAGAHVFPKLARDIFRPAFFAFTIFALLFQLQLWSPTVPRELALNPMHYLAKDLLRAPIQFYSGQRNPYRNRKDAPGAEQMDSIQLVDVTFVSLETNSPPAARLRGDPGKPESWNVLFFVLESTGADYVFDTTHGNEIPMPFLRQMADEGLHFENHSSPCNGSARSCFSIFSGLYPAPGSARFEFSKTLSIPLMNRHLGNAHHSFIVHPSSFTYSFPIEWIHNNGIKDLHSLETLPSATHLDHTSIARNEIDTISFLLTKLDGAKEPFLGIYWSFIPHHPYSDYGAEYRVRPEGRNSRDRYYNNLRALDVQLRRVFQHLRKTGKLDRTILVFVGDHGEAFGQHQGVWAHSVGTFGEMFRVPLIIYQPRLLEPQTVRRSTAHPDIVPTLLDLMGAQWDEKKFQGESAFRPSRRKYIFQMDAMGDYMSAIDSQMNKVSIGFEHGNTYAYNLARDPGEKVPLNEDRFGEQLNALVKFRNYQDQIVERYNAAILAGEKFPSKTSPPEKLAAGGASAGR